eukprot:579253-Hanusia_phi.AAC.1
MERLDGTIVRKRGEGRRGEEGRGGREGRKGGEEQQVNYVRAALQALCCLERGQEKTSKKQERGEGRSGERD